MRFVHISRVVHLVINLESILNKFKHQIKLLLIPFSVLMLHCKFGIFMSWGPIVSIIGLTSLIYLMNHPLKYRKIDV